MFVGDRNPGDTVGHIFNTRRTTGAPITLAGSPTLAVYRNGLTTEGTAGASLVIDFDGVTGAHRVQVDTSADGAFYVSGSRYQVLLVGGTVDALSVAGTVVLEFTLGLTKTIADYVDTLESGQTSIASTLTTIAGYTDTVEGTLATLGTNISAIKAKTDTMPSDTLAFLQAIAAYVDTVEATLATMTGTLGTLGTAANQTAAKAILDKLDALVEQVTGVYRLKAAALTQLPAHLLNVTPGGFLQVDLYSTMGDQLFPDDGGLLAVDATTATLLHTHNTASGCSLEVMTNGKPQTAVLGDLLADDPVAGARYEVIGGWLHGTPQTGDRYSVGGRALPEFHQLYREWLNRPGPDGNSLNTIYCVMAASAGGQTTGMSPAGAVTVTAKALGGNSTRYVVQTNANGDRSTVTITPPAPIV